MLNRNTTLLLTFAAFAALTSISAAQADTIGSGAATTCRSTYLTNSLKRVGHSIIPNDQFCDTAYFLPYLPPGPVPTQQQVDQAVVKYIALHPGAISTGGSGAGGTLSPVYNLNGKFYTQAQLNALAGRYSGGTVYIIDNKSYVIAAGGGNLNLAMIIKGTVIAAGGGNVIAAGGGNVIAAGGGNVQAGGNHPNN